MNAECYGFCRVELRRGLERCSRRREEEEEEEGERKSLAGLGKILVYRQ
jgi:hypothetical protein